MDTDAVAISGIATLYTPPNYGRYTLKDDIDTEDRIVEKNISSIKGGGEEIRRVISHAKITDSRCAAQEFG